MTGKHKLVTDALVPMFLAMTLLISITTILCSSNVVAYSPSTYLAKDFKVINSSITIVSTVNSVTLTTHNKTYVIVVPGMRCYWSSLLSNSLLTVGSYLGHPSIALMRLNNHTVRINYLSSLKGSIYDCKVSASGNLVCVGFVMINDTYVSLIIDGRLNALLSNKSLIIKVISCGNACYLRKVISLGSTYILVGGYAIGSRYSPMYLTYPLSSGFAAYVALPNTKLLGITPYLGVISDAALIRNYLVVSTRCRDGLAFHFIDLSTYVDRCYYTTEVSGVIDSSLISVRNLSRGVSEVFEVINAYGLGTCVVGTDSLGNMKYLCGIKGLALKFSKGEALIYAGNGTYKRIYLSLFSSLRSDEYSMNMEKRSIHLKHVRADVVSTYVEPIITLIKHYGQVMPQFNNLTTAGSSGLSTVAGSEHTFTRVSEEVPNIAYLLVGIALFTSYVLIKKKLTS